MILEVTMEAWRNAKGDTCQVVTLITSGRKAVRAEYSCDKGN